MCGIAGYVRTDGAPAEAAVIQQMNDAVRHRGPDGGDILIENSIALGHRRLSVIDLSNNGQQPMHYAPNASVLVFNGEIYNYRELRTELQARGHEFRSVTDSEVILAAYAEWGAECVSRFNGMWAFAILDRTTNKLFMSRDRFGVKPLYYCLTPRTFAFGSEIRQLLPFLGETRANREVVTTYLVTDASELSDKTFFDGIKRLPGGHNAWIDLATGGLQIERYYELKRQQTVSELKVGEAIERFTELLSDSIRLRLRSDVKVGTCLSGGIDSSTVATLASQFYRQATGSSFSAITAVSEQESTNEALFAQMVAETAELEWHQVRPTYRDFAESLDSVVAAQEEPFGSPSITMQYFVMKTARENGITVLLDGQGGDETLLGYNKYYAASVVSAYKRDGLLGVLSTIRATRQNNQNMGIANLAKYLVGAISADNRYAFYKRRHRHFREHAKRPHHLDAFSRSQFDSFALQKLEIETTNLPVLLRYEDKNSMAHAIEARLPFLDYRLLEFNLSLPDMFKIREGWSKWILRQSMAFRMPDAIVWRKNKFGFEAPDDLWLEQHRKEIALAVSNSQIISELTDREKLRIGLQRLDKRSVWRLYSLALWEKKFSVS